MSGAGTYGRMGGVGWVMDWGGWRRERRGEAGKGQGKKGWRRGGIWRGKVGKGKRKVVEGMNLRRLALLWSVEVCYHV